MGMFARKTSADIYLFPKDESGDPSIPQAVINLKDNTRNLYRLWWAAHYCFGFLGVIAGVLLTALSSQDVKNGPPPALIVFLARNLWLLGITAAVSTSLVTFLGPLQKAQRYWSAFHFLDQSCLEFEGSDADAQARKKKLMRRVAQARKVLQAFDSDEQKLDLSDDAKASQ